MELQFHARLARYASGGAGGSLRKKNRVTMPKLPPPPPWLAHSSLRCSGSDESSRTVTAEACPLASTTTISTAVSQSTLRPCLRESSPYPPPVMCPPAPTE